jgi:hypothetical protein
MLLIAHIEAAAATLGAMQSLLTQATIVLF